MLTAHEKDNIPNLWKSTMHALHRQTDRHACNLKHAKMSL